MSGQTDEKFKTCFLVMLMGKMETVLNVKEADNSYSTK